MGKFAAKGTLLQLSDGGGPPTFTTLANVRNISGPSLAQDPVEVSCHESASFYREFVSGFKDAGEVSAELLFDPADATQSEATDGLLDIYGLGDTREYRIVWPNTAGSEWDFSAIITGS